MRIERRYTKESQSAYADIEFRLTKSEIRNPDGSVVFHADDVEVPAYWSQVAADVLAQKYFRKAGVPARLKKVEEETVPSWLWRSVPDRRRSQRCRRRSAISAKCRRSRCSSAWPAPGPIGAGRAAISIRESRRARLLRRARLHAGEADGGAELAAMVQHRPALGLRHRRPEPGPFLRRFPDRQADQVEDRLRASAAACLLHPVGRRTTSSTRAASWICGCARRACSNTAPAPAPISPGCAAKANGSPAAASRPA